MIKGKLEFYFETGMEGAEWTVFDFENHTKDPNPYNSLHFLENGDKLRIYEKGNKIWEGIIKKDTRINLTDKTGYSYPRQVVKGHIVHWLQSKMSPERWADWFFDEKECELEKKVKPNG